MTELEQLRKELTAANLVIEHLLKIFDQSKSYVPIKYFERHKRNIAVQRSAEALAERDRKRDAALLRELAGNCLPNVRRYDSTVSVQKTLHNIAVADCVKHVFYLAAKRESGEWEPELDTK